MLKLDIEKFLILFVLIIIIYFHICLKFSILKTILLSKSVYPPDLPRDHSRFSHQSNHNTPFYSPLPIFPSEASQGYTKSNTLSKYRQMNNKQNYKMLWPKVPGTLFTPSPTVSYGSPGKSTERSSRGSGFGSQHSDGSSQPFVTPVPGDMIPYLFSTGSCTHVTHIHTYTQAHTDT